MLRDEEWEFAYLTGENDPLENFYRPALNQSNTYYRGVGYFSSSSFEIIGQPMVTFFENDGYMRLLTSVHLSEEDTLAIKEGMNLRELVEKELEKIIQEDFLEPLSPGCRMLGEMLARNKLDIKIATTASGGLYHEKLGVLIDEEDDYVSFMGSQNESRHSLQDTIESISVSTSWDEPKRAEIWYNRFDKLWNGENKSTKVFDLPDGIKKIIVKRAKSSAKGTEIVEKPTVAIPQLPTTTASKPTLNSNESRRYSYQEDAVEWFLNTSNNAGLYWMATGTGKTVTAMKTICKLFEEEMIDAVILCASDRLLKQWKEELSKPLPDGTAADWWLEYTFEHTAQQKEGAKFRQTSKSKGRLLYTTYSFLPELANDFIGLNYQGSRTLLLVDEVHNLGSPSIIQKSTEVDDDRYQNALELFGYRLGLSATPMHDFDDQRNKFLLSQFSGPYTDYESEDDWSDLDIDQRRKRRLSTLRDSNVVFYFGLKEAIQRGVLVEFDYIPWKYTPTPEEYEERQRVRRLWKKKIADGEARPGDDAIQAARVFKKSPTKLAVFQSILAEMDEDQRNQIFERSLLFVADLEFGRKLGRIISGYDVPYHEYFNEDDPKNLELFRDSSFLESLITCHMISEGIDIRSVTNIFLFSSDRQRLETVQRIGRALRKDPSKPDKRAKVFDFVNLETQDEDKPITADWERYNWLRELQDTEVLDEWKK